MKRFVLFLAPLMAITFLTNCNNGPKQYSVTVENHEHLSFTTLNGKELSSIKVRDKEDFTFKMKAINEGGSVDYLVPSFIIIKVNNTILEPTSCPIGRISDVEAYVTIRGSKITGDIVISGSAALRGRYTYQVFAHDGLKDIPSGSKADNENLSLTLEPLDGYEKPKDENILILFDNVPGENPRQWVSPSEKLDDYCTYNESSGQLTIKPDHIKNNVYIVTRAHNFKLLESLSWSKINQYSLAGWAPYIFYIGEEKLVKVNGLNHRVRIIDFNHDYTDPKKPDETKVGITFEFANVICNEHGPLVNYWHEENNYNFIESILNKFLNNDLFNSLPNDLKGAIKTVNKKVEVSNDLGSTFYIQDYLTKVFALSKDEISKEEKMYKYYIENSGESGRIKHNLSNIKWSYFLRSPMVETREEVYYIFDDGKIKNCVARETHATAPVFCI